MLWCLSDYAGDEPRQTEDFLMLACEVVWDDYRTGSR